MQAGSKTIIGIFSDLTDAKHCTDELRRLGISTVRLVENDQDLTFTGTAERQGVGSSDVAQTYNAEHKKTGIGAFFSRLFGFDDDRSSWNLSRDSEAFFKNAYDRRHHLVVVEDARDVTVSREVITRFGGQIEEQGGRFYETERYRDLGRTESTGLNTDQSLTGSSAGMAFDRDTSTRTSASMNLDRDTSAGMDLDRDTSLTERRSGFMEDQTSTRGLQDFNRDQSVSGARLDTDMSADMDSERVMELREEQLEVHTERMQTGEVHLRKELVTETKTIEVPVTHEEIVVERRPLHGAAREGTLEASLDPDQTEIRIPVSEEFVHIDKKVVPREEIRVSKEKITDTKTVSEDVHREEAHVESDGRVSIKDHKSGKIPPLSSSGRRDSSQPGV